MSLIPVVLTFNTSTIENYKMGGDSSHSESYSVIPWRQDHHFQTEVKVRASGLLFYFSESHYLSLRFYIVCFMPWLYRKGKGE